MRFQSTKRRLQREREGRGHWCFAEDEMCLVGRHRDAVSEVKVFQKDTCSSSDRVKAHESAMWLAFQNVKSELTQVVSVRSVCEIQNAVICNGDSVSEFEFNAVSFVRQQLRLLPVNAYIQQPLYSYRHKLIIFLVPTYSRN